jgi:AcrR family transcriptional regulator
MNSTDRSIEAIRAGSVSTARPSHSRRPASTGVTVVAESGTNLASIGYHFGSKEALLNTAVIDSFNDWDEEIERAIDARPGDAPADRLEAFLDGVVRGVRGNRALAMASVHAFAQFEYAPGRLAGPRRHQRPGAAMADRPGAGAVGGGPRRRAAHRRRARARPAGD